MFALSLSNSRTAFDQKRMSQTAEVAIAIAAYAIHHYMAAAAAAAPATSTSTAIESPFGNECGRGSAKPMPGQAVQLKRAAKKMMKKRARNKSENLFCFQLCFVIVFDMCTACK